jgi:hypothetical protein
MSIHFDEPFLTLHWDEDGRFVWGESKAATGREQLQRAWDAGVQLVIEKKAHRWLADGRNLGTIDPIDMKWTNEVLVPRLVAAGISRMAFLAPKRVVPALAVRSFMSRINDRVVATAYFDDFEAARAWLCAE